MSFQQALPPSYNQATAPPHPHQPYPPTTPPHPHQPYPAGPHPHHPQQQYYPPQPQQYPPPTAYAQPPPGPQPSAQVVSNVTVVKTGGGRGGVHCPSCNAQGPPIVTQGTPSSAWVWVFVLFLLGFFFPILWLGFCFIPLCVMTERRRACGACKYDLGLA